MTIPAAASQGAVAGSPQKTDLSNVGETHSPQVMHMFASTASGSTVSGATVSQSTLATALQGVDVASLQHPNGASIDWSLVAEDGIQFAAVKATQGAYYQNPFALTDLAAAKAAGLSTMAYAFAIPNGNSTGTSSASPVVQADYLLSYLGTDSTTVPIMLDIEYNPVSGGAECYGLSQSAMVTWISQFNAEVQKKTGQQPIIYTAGQWWTDCTGGSAAFSQIPLWEPYYTTTATSPALPTGWASWAFWQYSDSGTLSGISGNVDRDQLNPGVLPLLDPGAQRSVITHAVDLQVKPADPVSGQSPSFSATGLPPGVTISTGGQITGSPTAAGTFEATVTASNGQGVTGTVSFSWTVVKAVVTVKYVCGLSPSHYRWLVRNVGGTYWVKANAFVETSSGWTWVASRSISLSSGWTVNTYRGWALRIYYMADGSTPPPHEVGALISQASAPARSSRHAC